MLQLVVYQILTRLNSMLFFKASTAFILCSNEGSISPVSFDDSLLALIKMNCIYYVLTLKLYDDWVYKISLLLQYFLSPSPSLSPSFELQ